MAQGDQHNSPANKVHGQWRNEIAGRWQARASHSFSVTFQFRREWRPRRKSENRPAASIYRMATICLCQGSGLATGVAEPRTTSGRGCAPSLAVLPVTALGRVARAPSCQSLVIFPVRKVLGGSMAAPSPVGNPTTAGLIFAPGTNSAPAPYFLRQHGPKPLKP